MGGARAMGEGAGDWRGTFQPMSVKRQLNVCESQIQSEERAGETARASEGSAQGDVTTVGIVLLSKAVKTPVSMNPRRHIAIHEMPSYVASFLCGHPATRQADS